MSRSRISAVLSKLSSSSRPPSPAESTTSNNTALREAVELEPYNIALLPAESTIMTSIRQRLTSGVTPLSSHLATEEAQESLAAFLAKWTFPPIVHERYNIYAMTCIDISTRKYPISEDKYAEEFVQQPSVSDTGLIDDFLPPFTTIYEREEIPGWERFINPQGQVYFWNESCRAITPIDLYHPSLLEIVTNAINIIYHTLYCIHADQHRLESSNIPTDLQLVLDIFKLQGKVVLRYYFASFERRCPFWLGEVPVRDVVRGPVLGSGNKSGMWSRTHLRYFMEAEYWLHYKAFPDIQPFPPSLLDELQGLVLYAGIDKLLNGPITTNDISDNEIRECVRYVSLLGTKATSESANTSATSSGRKANRNIGYTTWSVGTLMRIFALHKSSNHHGKKNVRWRLDQPLHSESDNDGIAHPSFLLKLLSPLLFFIPDEYFFSLRTTILGRDEVPISEPWIAFVGGLHDEWKDLAFMASVIVATNIVFLSIPSLDSPSSDSGSNRSVSQILSYTSTILIIGSILLSQFIMRCHQLKGWEKADMRAHNNYGLLKSPGPNGLAIIYSMPYAFFMWGVLFFVAAFLALSLGKSDLITRIVVAIVLGLVGAVGFGVGVWAAWSEIVSLWLKGRDITKYRIVWTKLAVLRMWTLSPEIQRLRARGRDMGNRIGGWVNVAWAKYEILFELGWGSG
ncbi:hypothetical protein M422DRAFT_63161 [Sphaerobolus stellatus SS14]|nr:hypothetical protein M422DRAFT_63161 [Sphaerobolus stellatus SS14]